MRQLLLNNILLRDEAVFSNFYVSEKNMAPVRYLQEQFQYHFIYLYGKPRTGLTHLLQAVCHQSLRALYLPCREIERLCLQPEILENIAQVDVLAIDDIDGIAGQSRWEEALFHAYNQLQAENKACLIATHFTPSELQNKLTLPDLTSRLKSMLMLSVENLTDADKIKALETRARRRGLTLSPGVAQFILSHTARDMGYLMGVLDKLDKISLETQRRLTVPFVKIALGI